MTAAYPLAPCSKRIFLSAEKARLANRHAPFRFHVYFCPECRGYHVANHEKPGGKRGELRPVRRDGFDGDAA